MRYLKQLLSLCLIVSFFALVGCGGGGGGDSYVPAAGANPTPEAVPTAKVLNADLTKDEVQVQQAVSESLKTLANSFRTSVKANIKASAVPSGVPGLGSNKSINLNFLMGKLLSTLPTGGNIDSGVLIDSTDSKNEDYVVATYTSSNKTLEIASIDSIYKGWDNVNFKPIWENYVSAKTKITNCEATVTNGIMSAFSVDTGSVIEMKSYNKDNVLQETTKITLSSGVKIELSGTRTNTTTDEFTASPWNPNSGTIKKAFGNETTKITFTSPAKFDVTMTDNENNSFSGDISFTNMSGSYTMVSGYTIKSGATKNGATITETGPVYKDYNDNDTTHDNKLAFADSKLILGFNVNYINEKITLENGQIVMNNMTKQAKVGDEADARYKFSAGTGSMMVKYSGTNYDKYGYIYSLDITLSNLSFDPSDPDKAGEDSVITIKKTNSDNSVNTLSYKIKDGQPVLQPTDSNNFAGGSEKITVDETTGETTVDGTVNLAPKTDATADETLKISYSSTKKSNGQIRVRVTVVLGQLTRTMFFTRGTNRAIADGNIYTGDQASDSGDKYGTFNVNTTGTCSLIVGNNAPINFEVEI